MLHRLIVHNFQVHKKTKIDFGEGVTTIVGPTNAGKSSLIRSLFWLTFNRPRGKAFIKIGTQGSKATLLVDDKEITRVSGKGKNYYTLDKRKFKSFGAGVPDEISSLLNVSNVTFQRQHDGPFWLSLSPGEVSRELNQIINLSLIDSSLSNVASFLRNVNSKIEDCEAKLRLLSKDEESILWSEESDLALTSLEERNEVLVEKSARINALRSLLGNVAQYALEHRRASKAKLDAALAKDKARRLNKLAERIATIKDLVEEYQNLKSIMETKIPKNEMGVIEVKVKKLETLKDRISRLRNLLLRYENQQGEACLLRNQYLQESEYLESQVGGICPVCMKPL